MTQQRAADRLAAALEDFHGPSYFPGLQDVTIIAQTPQIAARAILATQPALADAIELGLILLSDDGPKALAEALHRIHPHQFWRWVEWLDGSPIERDGHSGELAAAILAALTAKLRERA